MISSILHDISLWEGFVAFLVANVVMFFVSLAGGHGVVWAFQDRRVTPEAPAIETREYLLATTCLVLNAVVTVGGLWLYRAGFIRLREPSWIEVPCDAVLLTFLMDVAMYASHRLAHHPWFYAHVHAVHHRYEHPRPLSLFVLHPIEVLGFGALWLSVLCVVTVSLDAMLLFLSLNLLFGTLGHVGVEPLPRAWPRWPLARHMGTSTFHAHHHERPTGNYGFYTTVWDRLLGTLDKDHT